MSKRRTYSKQFKLDVIQQSYQRDNIRGLDDELKPFDATVNRNFQHWVFDKQAGALKFNEEQMDWLRMIKNHIATSMHFSKNDLDYAPFDTKGGIGGMHKVFGIGWMRSLKN